MGLVKKTFQYGPNTVTMETGLIARQATSSVLIDMDGTTVLVTVVAKKEANHSLDFLPLTVNYQVKAYSAGKIPGGFIKREGRPSEQETLISRLIDRPIRPLFPEGFHNEMQVIATLLSYNPEVPADIVAMLGASAALTISGVPFLGPIGAARVGFNGDGFFLNPSEDVVSSTKLDLVVAGTEEAVLMVESEAKVLPESVMLEAVWYGHRQMQVAIQAIKEFAEEVGREKWNVEFAKSDQNVVDAVVKIANDQLTEIYQIPEKTKRQEKLTELRSLVLTQLINPEDTNAPTEAMIRKILDDIEKSIVRNRILDGKPRIDGRNTREVRPINIRTGILPRAHGSAVFTRGETQALVVTTLGSEKDAQTLDSASGESRDRFMFHYNFLPFCVGEIGYMSSPKRREIGHGKLAKRGISPVMPSQGEFKYVVRIVSEITESNGSSSMASVCGASLALMDAGVPIKEPVSGIAMGLIKEGNRFAILSDILGDEDHLGDMDFKVAGTKSGITALQMDIKITGISKYIMEKALEQANLGRMHILSIMEESISAPKLTLSPFAPTIITRSIPSSKIKDVIGKGGSTIRAITEETKSEIEISDDGTLSIAAVGLEAAEATWQKIRQIIADVEIGEEYNGKVMKLMEFGAFVNIMPGKDGFLHISQLADKNAKLMSDVLSEGQSLRVKVTDIDRKTNKIRLALC